MRRRISRRLLSGLGLLLVAALARPVGAAGDAADDLLRQGVELRRQGRDQDALEIFRKANDKAPTPRALAQMGLAEQALGRWTDSYEHLTAALKATGDAWIVKNHDVLETSSTAVRRHLGELEILGEPKGAEVRVDGRLHGTLPLPGRIRTAVGTASVEVRAPGFIPITRTVLVSADELVRETIVLQPTSAPLTAANEQTVEPVHPPAAGDGSSPSPPWMRPVAWGATAGAGLFAVGGAIALVVRESKAQWFVDKAHGCNENLPDRGGASCKDAFDAGHTAGNVAVGSFIAAGVLGIGATVLFLRSEPAGDSSHGGAVSLACAPYERGFGLNCAARF